MLSKIVNVSRYKNGCNTPITNAICPAKPFRVSIFNQTNTFEIMSKGFAMQAAGKKDLKTNTGLIKNTFINMVKVGSTRIY